MSRKPTPWKHSVGEKPNTVTVFERRPGGTLYARVWDPTMGKRGGWRKKSLGHKDKDRAKRYAAEQHAKLVEGDEEARQGQVTAARVFMLYERHRTPRKSASEQQADGRRIELWTRWLGGKTDPHTISLREWEAFIDARGTGEIDPRGRHVPDPTKRHPVRTRSVQADLNWLRWVFNWAVRWRTPEGHYLMRENPVRGYEAPTEKNPRRPVATADRYDAVRAVSDEIRMEARWEGKRKVQRSYLSEILDLVAGTGRRISAVCALRYSDLRLNDGTPHGSIRWPADTDKEGKEATVPISPLVRHALDRVLTERPGIGKAPLFPSPVNREKPVRYERVSDWLREAEKLAELEPQEGTLWHAYRRKWATERKHLPAHDVAQAGGWAGPETLQVSYQHADPDTMLQVVLEGGELREAK